VAFTFLERTASTRLLINAVFEILELYLQHCSYFPPVRQIYESVLISNELRIGATLRRYGEETNLRRKVNQLSDLAESQRGLLYRNA
jgi:hypothetical protein